MGTLKELVRIRPPAKECLIHTFAYVVTPDRFVRV
jgi:hypothetical protein